MSAMEKAMEAEREVTREVTRRVQEVQDKWEKWQTSGRRAFPFEFPLRPFPKVTIPSLVKGLQMKMQLLNKKDPTLACVLACCQTRTQYQKPWKNIKSTSCPFLPDPARDFLTAIDLEIESLIV